MARYKSAPLNWSGEWPFDDLCLLVERLDLFGCAADADAEMVLIRDHAYPILKGRLI